MKNITLDEALTKLPEKKRIWFKYLFPDTRPDQTKPTLEKTMANTSIKTEFPIIRWQQTQEFKWLVALYLSGKTANDLLDMYAAVKENAIKGDEKSVKLLLQLQREIELQKKEAIKEILAKDKSDKDKYDDLDV